MMMEREHDKSRHLLWWQIQHIRSTWERQISATRRSQDGQTTPSATAQLHRKTLAGGSSNITTYVYNEAEDKGKEPDALVSGSTKGAKKGTTECN